jgi:hypothetical protein
MNDGQQKEPEQKKKTGPVRPWLVDVAIDHLR